MSFKSKFRQFVQWIGAHSAKNDPNSEFEPDFTNAPVDTGNSWVDGETKAYQDQWNESSKWWVSVGSLVAGYLDEKTGMGGKVPPNSGPITGDNDKDMMIIVGSLIGIVLFLRWVFNEIF